MTDSTATISRDAAIEAAERGAGQHWMDNAVAAIRLIADGGTPFTTEDVRALVSNPPEPRAWGAAIKRAQLSGLIRPTGRWVQARSATCHCRPMREWVRA